MLSRRAFLRASSLVAAGVIAHDQLDILDRLAPRSLFASAEVGRPMQTFEVDMSRLLKEFYSKYSMHAAALTTPFLAQLSSANHGPVLMSYWDSTRTRGMPC